MGEEDLAKVHHKMIKQGIVRHRHVGTKLRKISKGDYVRIVEDKFRRLADKATIGKAHLDYGVRWEKGVHLVLKAARGSVWVKRPGELAPRRHRRVHVQLVPKNSDARKSYDDRPKFDDKYDPERAARTNEQQNEPSKEDKEHLI